MVSLLFREKNLYKNILRSRFLSVRPTDRPSVRSSVRPSVRRSQWESCRRSDDDDGGGGGGCPRAFHTRNVELKFTSPALHSLARYGVCTCCPRGTTKRNFFLNTLTLYKQLKKKCTPRVGYKYISHNRYLIILLSRKSFSMKFFLVLRTLMNVLPRLDFDGYFLLGMTFSVNL